MGWLAVNGQPGRYNSVLPTIPNGYGAALAVDVNGRLITSPTTGSSSNQVQGTAADAATAVGNPIDVAVEYLTTPPVLTNGQHKRLQGDVNGNLKVTLATQLAGEDLTNDVMKVEQRFTTTRATADVQIKGSAGFVHAISIAPISATPTAGLLTIYNSLTETGTVIYREWITTTTMGHTVMINASASTGIFAGFDGTLAGVEAFISWR